jgi:uncharacterized Zn finger protein
MNITESILKSLSTAESYARGSELYLSDAIFDTFRQGNVFTGKCEGTSAPFYQLRVTVDESGIQEAICTCPYDWGGLCKHVIALMLTYIHDSDAFIEHKRVEELLNNLDKESLVRLIGKMVDKDPDLYAWLQTAAQSSPGRNEPEPVDRKQKTQVSETDYRRRIRNILHSLSGYRGSEAYWMMGGMVRQLEEVQESAYTLLEAGDAEGALVIFSILLSEVNDHFGEFDDSDGELAGFLNELAQPMLEAILSANLSPSERSQLADELDPVIDELSSFGIDELSIIISVLEEDDLADHAHDPDDFDESILVGAQLNVLERQGRTDEFLRLCLKTGQYLRYILKQIEIGRYDQAMSTAWKSLTQANEALAVAKALHNTNHQDDALQLAEKGLELGGSRDELGLWLGQIEETQGRFEQAIRAYQAAFTSSPSLWLYQTLRKLSGQGWETLKLELMHALEGNRYPNEMVDIALFEKDWDTAIAIAQRLGSWQYNLMEKVADGVIMARPDWVIQASREQAEALIEKTQSKYYAIAAHWLAKMKQAYQIMGKEVQWRDYLDGLKNTYSRRPALQAELKKL